MLSRRRALAGLAAPLFGGACAHARQPGLPDPLLYTPELARRLEPAPFPFAVEYARGSRQLLFIAARHEIGRETPTAQLIRNKATSFQPRLIIIEGLESALGRNPPGVVSRLQADLTTDSANEARVAAETALRLSVPFQGGEPGEMEVFNRLVAGGFDKDDLLFADLIKVMPTLVGSGDITGVGDPRFVAGYPRYAAQLAGRVGAAPLSLERFKAMYVKAFGVAPEDDALLVYRTRPDETHVVGRILQAQTQLRDRAILGVIEDALNEAGRVLVVYGGSHWTTLSAPLAALLGPPTFDLHPRGSPG